ncbi:MAG: hypothetical protein ACK48V_11785 [Crocinitomicaceae bacterium]|jgi:hypothetical protein
MKNKGVTFILLIVVGIVWYKVFFRIKENLTTDDNLLVSSEIKKANRLKFTKDTFQLSANYRDPFHSKSASSSQQEDVSMNTNTAPVPPITYQAPKPVPVPKPHKWPKMKFYGVMKSNPQKGNLAILAIDNVLFNLREGEVTYDGIVLKKIYGDSVLFTQDKHSRMLRK